MVNAILPGFQANSFRNRIEQEIKNSSKELVSWMPVAKYLNLAAMLCIVLGVFIAPVFIFTALMFFWLEQNV